MVALSAVILALACAFFGYCMVQFGRELKRSRNRLTCYGLSHVNSRGGASAFTLAFAGSCLLASVYGFLQGAWPFGLVEAIWSVVPIRRWYTASRGEVGVPHGIAGQRKLS